MLVIVVTKSGVAAGPFVVVLHPRFGEVIVGDPTVDYVEGKHYFSHNRRHRTHADTYNIVHYAMKYIFMSVAALILYCVSRYN